MGYTTLSMEGSHWQELSQEQTHSLYEICQQIGDKRAARGKQYDLAGLLMVLAKLAGMKSRLGASDWSRDQAEYLRQHLQMSWKHMPCATTYKYALARLDRRIEAPGTPNEQIEKGHG